MKRRVRLAHNMQPHTVSFVRDVSLKQQVHVCVCVCACLSPSSEVQQWAAATVARTQASLKANATLQAEYSHDHDVVSAGLRRSCCRAFDSKRAPPSTKAQPGDGDKLPKSARAQAFADWLVDTYSLEFLRSGCGVLDVAGGKGALVSSSSSRSSTRFQRERSVVLC